MDNFEQMSCFFKASGHGARLELLKDLKEIKEATARDLSDLLDVSQTYTHRHLQILIENGLVKKEGKLFVLSTIGKIFVNSLGSAEVITMYEDFWESHDVSRIPEKLIEEFFVLKNTKLANPAPIVLETILSTALKAESRVLAVSDRIPRIAVPTFRKIMKEGIEVHLLAGDISHGGSTREYLKINGLEVNTIKMEDIYMGLMIIDNREAGVMFPDTRGALDWNFGLGGTDPSFISWVEKNFWNMYENKIIEE